VQSWCAVLVFAILVLLCVPALHAQGSQGSVTDLAGPGSVTGNYTITGQNSRVSYSLNGVQFIDGNKYACNSTGISAAITALPSGGTVDARGCGAVAIAWVSTVIVPTNITLIFDAATLIQPSTSSLTIFKFEPGSRIFGATLDCANQAAWSGIFFRNDSTVLYNFQGTELGWIKVATNCNRAPGTALYLNSPSVSDGIAFLDVHDWHVVLSSAGTGFFFTSSSTGFINDNHFSNIVWTQAQYGWHLSGGGGSIIANVCTACSYEANTNPSGIAVRIDGVTSPITQNQYYGNSWDNTTAVSISNKGASANFFLGFFGGNFSDTSGNVSQFIPLGSFNGFQVPQFYGMRVYGTGASAPNAFGVCDSVTGDSTPCKFFMVNIATPGVLNIRNNAYTANIWTLDDHGNNVVQALKIADEGTCTMSGGTCPAQSLSHVYNSAPKCFANWTGTGMLTGLLKVPSTTSAVTPASSVGTDTAQVNWGCFGN
jgi:hypothetical protein